MEKSDLLRHWRFRIHRVQIGHYESARSFEKRNFWLGIFAVGFNAIVGTAVFASLAEVSEGTSLLWPKISVGLISVTAAVLVSLQTFLRYSEQSEKHKSAAAKYAHLKHKLELLATMPPETDDALKIELAALESEWEKVREDSLNIPTKIWKHIEKEMTFEKDIETHPEFGKKA